MTDRSRTPILLVEDDETLAGLLARHLRAHGSPGRVAPTAEAASRAGRRARGPSLVLLDINLPGETGWALLRTEAYATPASRRSSS